MGATVSTLSTEVLAQTITKSVMTSIQTVGASGSQVLNIINETGAGITIKDSDLSQALMITTEAVSSDDFASVMNTQITQDVKQAAEAQGALLGALGGILTEVKVNADIKSIVENFTEQNSIQSCIVAAAQEINIVNKAGGGQGIIDISGLHVQQQFQGGVTKCVKVALMRNNQGADIAQKIQASSKATQSNMFLIIMIFAAGIVAMVAFQQYQKKQRGEPSLFDYFKK